ncbi:uncharacterized protein DC041_0000925 [Schistosoma bovis]|uniref:Uncharacterized protein n=1 Tax=Schistosoma bovis TaxID=6184 RepID=A0A430QTM9_SCHBO|nr:uncharacterized protein DC041_0000925 [Schistosoma bovis]
MATAGMRLLTQTDQDAIWKRVRSHVKSTYKFQFKESHAYTISGVEEGSPSISNINCLEKLSTFYSWSEVVIKTRVVIKVRRPLFPGENENEQLACIMEVLGLPSELQLEKASRRRVFFGLSDNYGLQK